MRSSPRSFTPAWQDGSLAAPPRIAAALEHVHGNDHPRLAELTTTASSRSDRGCGQSAGVPARQRPSASASSLSPEAAPLYAMVLQPLAACPRPDEVQRCDAAARWEKLAQARPRATSVSAGCRRRAPPRALDLLARTALRLARGLRQRFTHDRPLIALVEEALAAVDGGVCRCASLIAILAGERYWSGIASPRSRSPTMPSRWRSGSVIARALVSVLWVRCQVRWGPENVEERLGRATEIASMAEAIGDHQRALPRARDAVHGAARQTG